MRIKDIPTDSLFVWRNAVWIVVEHLPDTTDGYDCTLVQQTVSDKGNRIPHILRENYILNSTTEVWEV